VDETGVKDFQFKDNGDEWTDDNPQVPWPIADSLRQPLTERQAFKLLKEN
jgi:hypothetical protein